MAGAQRSMRSVPGRPDSGRAGAPSSPWAGLAGFAPPPARAASLREVFSSVSAQSCGPDGMPCQSPKTLSLIQQRVGPVLGAGWEALSEPLPCLQGCGGSLGRLVQDELRLDDEKAKP